MQKTKNLILNLSLTTQLTVVLIFTTSLLAYEIDLCTYYKVEMIRFIEHWNYNLQLDEIRGIKSLIRGHSLQKEIEYLTQQKDILDTVIEITKYLRYFLIIVPSICFTLADKKQSPIYAQVGISLAFICSIIYSVCVHIYMNQINNILKLSGVM